MYEIVIKNRDNQTAIRMDLDGNLLRSACAAVAAIEEIEELLAWAGLEYDWRPCA